MADESVAIDQESNNDYANNLNESGAFPLIEQVEKTRTELIGL